MTNSTEFPTFPADCKSSLCKHLSKEVFNTLKDQRTSQGFTLAQVINSGVQHPDSHIGVYAGDAESYIKFAALFDPIIEEYHGFTKHAGHTQNLNSDDLNAPDPDPEGRYIISTRIRVARNLLDFPMGSAISRAQRNDIERRVSGALADLSGELAGHYYPLTGMQESDRARLVNDHFLFKSGDRFFEAAGLNRHWPEGRGIFHNADKTFLVWLNEEDQLRIISMQNGGNIKQVFRRLVDAISKLQQKLEFSCSAHLGYLTSCPSNLGTAMRASVHIKLPNLASNMELLRQVATNHHLQIRGVHGEGSESEDSVYDISNRRRLGVTEVECVQDMYNGVVALIAAERSF